MADELPNIRRMDPMLASLLAPPKTSPTVNAFLLSVLIFAS